MLTEKSILVTGGTGLIGRQLVDLLISHDANVTIVSLLDFEVIPEQARRYITIRASRIFHDRTLGANALHRFSRQDELVALSILKQAEASVADHNIFNSYDQFTTVARSRSHKLID